MGKLMGRWAPRPDDKLDSLPHEEQQPQQQPNHELLAVVWVKSPGVKISKIELSRPDQQQYRRARLHQQLGSNSWVPKLQQTASRSCGCM
jgi:hypothetical protein